MRGILPDPPSEHEQKMQDIIDFAGLLANGAYQYSCRAGIVKKCQQKKIIHKFQSNDGNYFKLLVIHENYDEETGQGGGEKKLRCTTFRSCDPHSDIIFVCYTFISIDIF